MVLTVAHLFAQLVGVQAPAVGIPLGGNVNLLQQGVDALHGVGSGVRQPVEELAERLELAEERVLVLGHIGTRLRVVGRRGVQVLLDDVGGVHVVLVGVLVEHVGLLVQTDVLPGLRSVVEVAHAERVDERGECFLVALTQAPEGGAAQTVHPTLVGVGDDAREGLDEVLVGGAGAIVGDIAQLMGDDAVTFLPRHGVVGARRHLTESHGVSLGLVQDVRELVVHGVEVTLVEHHDVVGVILHVG